MKKEEKLLEDKIAELEGELSVTSNEATFDELDICKNRLEMMHRQVTEGVIARSRALMV